MYYPCPALDCKGYLYPDPNDKQKHSCNSPDCSFETRILKQNGNAIVLNTKKEEDGLEPWGTIGQPKSNKAQEKGKDQDGERLPNYTQPSILPGRVQDKPLKLE